MDYTPGSSGIFPAGQQWLNMDRLINVIHHIIKMNDKNCIIISIDVEKLWQNSAFFYDKTSQQTGYRGNVSKHNKIQV